LLLAAVRKSPVSKCNNVILDYWTSGRKAQQTAQ